MTLSVNNVSKIIEGNPILENVNFDMEAGSIVGLVGCNSVGKTTLMRLIAGEMQPESGQIQFDETGRTSVFYLDTLSNWMTSYTAILATDVFVIFYPQFNREHFEEILCSQKLPLNKTIASLSKGQKALVCIAAGIASQANYLLFDEPLDGLDVFVKDYFKALLLEAVDEGRGVIIATHNLAELDSLADRILLINDRYVIEQENDTDIVKIQFVYEGEELASNLTDVATILEKRGRVYIALISESLIPILQIQRPINLSRFYL
jgi:ABC-2 type transport system ATP-binding protein